MGVYIKGMQMPKSCEECRWFYHQGTLCVDPPYHLDARCKLIPPTQDWYGYDRNGGWVGDDIDPDKTKGYYYYHHCVQKGTRAKQCPLKGTTCSLGSELSEEQMTIIVEKTEQWSKEHPNKELEHED